MSSYASALPSSKRLQQARRSALLQAFSNRHFELTLKCLKVLDWNRHDHNIHEKVLHWTNIIKTELDRATIVRENGYNINESKNIISIQGSTAEDYVRVLFYLLSSLSHARTTTLRCRDALQKWALQNTIVVIY